MLTQASNGLVRHLGKTFSTQSANAGMNIHLLGAGSTGCLLAVHLQRSIEQSKEKARRKDTITLQLRRPPTDDQIDGEEKVRLSVLDASQKEKVNARFRWESSAQSYADPIDVLIVTTKADQTINALEPLVPRLASPHRTCPATLVLVQNGVGLDEGITEAFGWHQAVSKPFMLLGINSNGTWTRSRFETVHAALSDIKLGVSALTEQQIGRAHAERLMMDTATIDEERAHSTQTLSNIVTLLRSEHSAESLGTACLASSKEFSVHQQRKLVSNCALNPLAALYNVRNGELRTHVETREKVAQIVDECAQVLQARYHSIHGQSAQLPKGLTSDDLHRYVWNLIEITRGNWCSMVQDMWSGRGSTEIAFLNGTIVRWAMHFGLSTPLNAEMVEKIDAKAKEVQGKSRQV